MSWSEPEWDRNQMSAWNSFTFSSIDNKMGHIHPLIYLFCHKTESELFADDMSKDSHSPGPVIREVSP